MGTQLPHQSEGTPLCQFSAYVCCGQMSGWIKTPVGTGHIVLDGDAASTRKRHSSPLPRYGPCLLWPNGCRCQLLLRPCVGPGHPFLHFFPLSFHFLIVCSFLLFPFSFSHLLYLFSSFVHPFPFFYQSSPTPFPGRRL